MPTKSKAKQKNQQHKHANAQTPTSSQTTSPTNTAEPAVASYSPAAAASPIAAANGVSSPSTLSLPETLKDKGNKAFAVGSYQKALELYTQAIDAAASLSSSDSSSITTSPSSPSPATHTLFSNRSAAYLNLKNFSAALQDAESAIEQAPTWPKGYLRKGQALEQLLRYHDAHRAYKEGLACDPHDSMLNRASEALAQLLNELKISEDELNIHHQNPDSDRFIRMTNWLHQGGAQFPKLYLQYYSEDYRGVHCLCKVPADDIILFVPFTYIMTSQVAMESEIGSAIVESKVDLRSKHSYLAAYLLQEKEKSTQSFWYPYIAALPTHYHNMPIFFDTQTLSYLKGSFTLQKIQDRIDSLQTEYENIRAAVPAFGRFSAQLFVWARLVVITRIFGLVIHGTKTDGLVPFADMLNHRRARDGISDTDTKWTFDDTLDGFTITSLKPIQRGEQVYDSYGRKCNSRFFVNYGFSLADNEEDNEVVMRFSLSPNDPFYTTKQLLLQTHNGHHNNQKNILQNREFQVPATYRDTADKEKKTKEMFSFLRYICAVDSELLILGEHADNAATRNGTMTTPSTTHKKWRIEDIDPISIRNESAVLRQIQAAAEYQLSLFDTTLQQDEAMLQQYDVYPLYSNVRNCIIQRRGEKQVLHWYLNVCQEGLRLLAAPWKDVKKQTQKCFQSTAPLDYYIASVIVPLVKKS